MIVLDASAALDLVLNRPERGPWVADRIATAGSIHAPHLLDVELVSALRKLARIEALADARAGNALDRFAQLRIIRYPARLAIERIWALRNALSAYDACYVALAEALDAPLVTTDDRLARSTGHRATVVGFAG